MARQGWFVRPSSKMYRRTIRMEFTVSCSPLIERIIAGKQSLPLTSQFEPGELRWARR